MEKEPFNVMEKFKAKTGLTDDECGYLQEGGSGYGIIVIARESKLVRLGMFSYAQFIRNERGYLGYYPEAVDRFVDLCIRKMNGEEIKVPELLGNPDYWDPIYKATMEEEDGEL